MGLQEYSGEDLRRLAFQRWGIELFRNGREWHGPCPFCRTGRDRFILWPEGNFFCRVCEERGWLEDHRQDWRPDPDLQAAFQANLQKQREQQQRRLSEWQAGFQAGYIQGWHDAMTEANREYWRSQGIPDWAIETYNLGFCASRRFEGRNGTFFDSPAYTIPINRVTDWAPVNVQYRLTKLPAGERGKYRQEQGLPQATFFADPKNIGGQLILVEGAKKAIVLFELIQYKVQVAGLPGQTPSARLLAELEPWDRIYLILDPGEGHDAAAARIGRLLHPRVRLVEMGVKPDDAVVQYGMDRGLLRSYLQQARRL